MIYLHDALVRCDQEILAVPDPKKESETAISVNASPSNSGPDPKKESETAINANASPSNTGLDLKNSDPDLKKESETAIDTSASWSNSGPVLKNSDPDLKKESETAINANASPSKNEPDPNKESNTVPNVDPSPSNSGSDSKEEPQTVTNANTSLSKSSPESDEAMHSSQRKPVGLLYSIQLEEEGKTDRIFYSAKVLPGIKDYMAEEDDAPLSWFEIMFYLEGKSKEDAAIKTMKKKDFDHVEDFINLEKDFTIDKQYAPTLKIDAPGVISAFRDLIKYDPYQITAGKQMYLFWGESWFYPSWYHKELVELQKSLREGRSPEYVASEQANNLTSEETANQIGQLLDIMRPYHEKNVISEWELHSMSPPLATFERLWLLFIPGERVYTKVDGELSGFVVTSTHYKSHEEDSRTRNAGKRMMHALIWNYRLVDGKVVRHQSEVSIEEFKDQREITLLPVFPSSVYDKSDDGKLRRKLETRGRKYYELIRTKFAHKEYHGRTLDSKPVEVGH